MTKWLLIKSEGKDIPEIKQEIPVNGIITVGSEPSSTITLQGEQVAVEQFVIVCEDDRMLLLCRVEGTVINGENLPQGFLHNLQIGDRIVVGDYKMSVEDKIPEENRTSDEQISEIVEESVKPNKTVPRDTGSLLNPLENSQKSLKDILEGLRAEEKFYFLIQNGSGEDRRVYVETEEMWLGWNAEGKCILSVETENIASARAQIRKDWSGVVMYPLQTGNVWLNNQPLNEPHRLKNDDRLSLMALENRKPCLKTIVKFHEPTALLVLDSILPKELPPPISFEDQRKNEFDNNADRQTSGSAEIQKTGTNLPIAPITSVKKLIFGYFTFLEIIIMAIGTLITAAMIFLVLEFF